MKTMSDHESAKAARRQKVKDSFRKKLSEILEKAELVKEVYVATEDWDKTDYVERRKGFRDGVKRLLNGDHSPWGVDYYDFACDHCGTQLMNLQANMTLTTSPPKKHVHCLGCGWSGYTSA